MSEPDLLFTVRNSFYLGAFQGAIAEASDLEGLSEAAKTERDTFVYRSWIELGSYEVERLFSHRQHRFTLWRFILLLTEVLCSWSSKRWTGPHPRRFRPSSCSRSTWARSLTRYGTMSSQA